MDRSETKSASPGGTRKTACSTRPTAAFPGENLALPAPAAPPSGPRAGGTTLPGSDCRSARSFDRAERGKRVPLRVPSGGSLSERLPAGASRKPPGARPGGDLSRLGGFPEPAASRGISRQLRAMRVQCDMRWIAIPGLCPHGRLSGQRSVVRLSAGGWVWERGCRCLNGATERALRAMSGRRDSRAAAVHRVSSLGGKPCRARLYLRSREIISRSRSHRSPGRPAPRAAGGRNVPEMGAKSPGRETSRAYGVTTSRRETPLT